MVCRWWREVGEVPQLWTWACLKVDCHLYSAQILQEMFASRRLQSVRRMKVRSDYGVRSNEVAVLEALLPVVAKRPGLLESLDLSRPRDGHTINLNEVDAKLLAQAVTHLVEINFSNLSCLTAQQMNAIFAALLDDSSLLKRLTMYYVDLFIVDYQIMARVINKLEEVDLTGAAVTSKQAIAVFTLMIKNSNLKKLNLDITKVADRFISKKWRHQINGVNPELLAEALTHLEEVKLPTCLDLEQKNAIFATLDASQGQLKRLDISGNDLSDVDAVLVANVVNKMEFVDIQNTDLTVSQITAILKQSVAATSLKELLIMGWDKRKFRRQTKRIEKLLARALQVIPTTDLWPGWEMEM